MKPFTNDILKPHHYERLLHLSRHSEIVSGSSHVAAILYKRNIICVGTNKKKTHPLQKKFQDREHRIYLHAEIDAIVQCISRHGSDILKDCDLIVLRTLKNGELANSKPCKGCQDAIKAFKIKNVYHS